MGLKLLLVDVEMFPNVGCTWGTWDQRVIKVLKRRMVCSIAWKWHGQSRREVLALPDFPGYDPKAPWTNKALIKTFSREVLAGADVVIGHNLVDFDDKRINSDLFLQKLRPGAPYRMVDTLKVCRARFDLNSNKLGDVCEELGIGKKLPHPGFPMWEGCMEGDKKSWALMKRYNLHDVDPLLEGLYEHLLPWIPNHPNLSLGEMPGCPRCKHKVLKSDGSRHTNAGSYKKMLCLGCRSWCKGVVVRGKLLYRL